MKSTHPNIIIDFVPRGCTGVWQACNVGIQCPFKHSLEQFYHEDVIVEVLDAGDEMKVNTKLGAL